MQISVKTFAGLEKPLSAELAALGATDIEPGTRIVSATADQQTLYRVNYSCRTALRVLVPIHTFRATHERRFYSKIRQLDWTEYLDIDQTLAVDAVTYSRHFRHSKYIALKTKDAIVDQFRDRFQRRPSVDVQQPDVRIHVHVSNDLCTVSLDSSGDSLHKRGYRVDTVEAPINEVLAAGMVMLSGWQADRLFMDPMCGSGTLLTEAAMIAANIAPQRQRREFGFQRWKDYDKSLWQEVKQNADAQQREVSVPILGFDRDFKAVKISHHNIMAAGLSELIQVEKQKFEKLEPPPAPGLLMMNPPYDERLTEADISAFYKMIGDTLKQSFAGYEAWIISSNRDALKNIGLRSSQRLTLFNGPLECKFLQFELYEGSRKK